MIAIIDYGAGNIESVRKAFEFIGAEAVLTSDPEVLKNADAAVLPGVARNARSYIISVISSSTTSPDFDTI